LASAPLSNNECRGCCRNLTGPVDCVSLLATAHLQTRATMFPAYEHTVSGSRSLLLMRAVADPFAPKRPKLPQGHARHHAITQIQS
jgi:hypothetical protein